MKLFPLVSLLTIGFFFIFLQFIVGSNYYLRQRYRPSVIYLYRYFTYIDILFRTSNGRSVVVIVLVYQAGDSGSIPCWRNILLVSFFFKKKLHFVTLQESIAFHLLVLLLLYCVHKDIWAALWQNQLNGMCAQRRLRSAWASAQSDQSLRCLGSFTTHWAHSEDSVQTGRMHRLIWVFAWRTCHYVGFVVWWLICNIWW